MMNTNNPSNRSDKLVDASSCRDHLSDVDRYLLDDPTLDREAFESRMAEDLELCEQVALAVDQLQLLRNAAKSLDSVNSVTLQSSKHVATVRDSSWLYAITAIATVILIGVFSLTLTRQSRNDLVNDQNLAMLADSWLDASVESSDEAGIVNSGSSMETTFSTDSESDASESSDWMLDAAREYFLENQNGAAG